MSREGPPSPGDQAERIVERLDNANVDLFACEADREEAVEIVREELDAFAAALQSAASPHAAPGSAAPAGQPLWCVHVRGPDDVVPVASYDDAARMADGLNWWWWSFREFTENDPLISAIPALWEGTPERHAQEVAKLGTRGADYAVPTEEQVEAKRKAAFALRVGRSRAEPAGQAGGLPAGWVAVPREPTEEMIEAGRLFMAADRLALYRGEPDSIIGLFKAMLAVAPQPPAAAGAAACISPRLREAINVVVDCWRLGSGSDAEGCVKVPAANLRALNAVLPNETPTPPQRPSREEIADAMAGLFGQKYGRSLHLAIADAILALPGFDAPSAAGRDEGGAA